MAAQALPNEVVDLILREAMAPCPAPCIFEHFVPDWHLCPASSPVLEDLVRTSRMDIYTAATPTTKPSVRTSFSHSPEDCIRHPTCGNASPYYGISKQFDRVVAWMHFTSSLQVFTQRIRPVGHLGRPGLAAALPHMNVLRGHKATDLLPFLEGGRRPKAVLLKTGSFVFSELRHVMLNTDREVFNAPLTAFGSVAADDDGNEGDNDDDAAAAAAETETETETAILRANLDALQSQIEVETRSQAALQWARMTRLETVCLDLRSCTISTRSALRINHIREVAAQMCEHLSLELLVIAGLRSGAHWPSARELTDLRQTEPEWRVGAGGQAPNYIAMFKGALRPGGRLILVDKQCHSLPALQAGTVRWPPTEDDDWQYEDGDGEESEKGEISWYC